MSANAKVTAGIAALFTLALAMVSLAPSAAADPPGSVNFQGMARDAGGNALDGPVAMVFRFYDDPAAGTVLWEEMYDPVVYPPAVSVSEGLFTVALGDPGHRNAGSESSFQDIFVHHGTVYLGVAVGEDPEMTPRIAVASAPFALNTAALDGRGSDDFAEAVHTHAGNQIVGAVADATNADKLDGQDATAFATASHAHSAADVTSGTLAVTRGGTGLASPGASGNILTSTGSAWASSAAPTAASFGAVVDAADTTLTRSGAGTVDSPFKLALNLGSANHWTGPQTFQQSVYIRTDDPRLNMESFASEWGPIINLSNDSPTQTNLGSIFFRKEGQAATGEITCAGDGSMIVGAGGQKRLFIDSAGKVGIGTTDPQYSLDIQGQLPKLRLKSTSGSGTELYFESSAVAPSLLGQIIFTGPTNAGGISYYASGKMHFASNSGTRMVIDDAGNVGVGTTSPACRLDVVGDANIGSSATSNKLYMKDQEAVWTDGTYFSWGYGGTANRFYDPVGIGGIAPVYKLQISTDSAAKPATNTWTVPSDARLKKDIAPFTDGLEVLAKIRPISYRYNGLAGLPADMPCIGVSAQDIKDVAPYTVGTFRAKLTERDEAETELYDFNSHALTFILINAVKELDRKFEGLSAEGSPDAKEVRKGLSPPAVSAKALPHQDAGTQGDGWTDTTPPTPTVAAPLPYLAAPWPVCERVEVGDILVTDPGRPGYLCPSAAAQDSGVVGVVTTVSGGSPEAEAPSSSDTSQAYVAMSGLVQAKVDAAYGPIATNDLLVTSPTPGHAMKAPTPIQGTVLGKALESLDQGTGLIRILVMLR